MEFMRVTVLGISIIQLMLYIVAGHDSTHPPQYDCGHGEDVDEQPMLELPPAHHWYYPFMQLQLPQRGRATSHAYHAHGDRHTSKRLHTMFPWQKTGLEDLVTDKFHLPDPVPLKPPSNGSSSLWNLFGSSWTGQPTVIPALSTNDEAHMQKGQKRKHPIYSCSLQLNISACLAYATQALEPMKSKPQESKPCPSEGCGAGNCHHGLGLCMCPAGWTGPTCAQELKRPCAHRGHYHSDPLGMPISHIHAVTKHDLNWSVPGWTASRCAGYCDDTIAMCYCGYGSKFAHVPAPDGAPLGALPMHMGRSMLDPCKPSTDASGHPAIGRESYPMKWKDYYGPLGWCNEDPVELKAQDGQGTQAPQQQQQQQKPKARCPCLLDNMAGEFCEHPKESYCPAQCTGHGRCLLGFCKCHDGWYGTDCSSKAAAVAGDVDNQAQTSSPSGEEQSLPELPAWIRPVIRPSVRVGAAVRTMRRRPFIYVYDLPPDYNSRLLQYRIVHSQCTWRYFHGPNNASMMVEGHGYGIESYLHEAMLMSAHRTLDPEEADFFYVPVYIACLMYPVLGWADYPFYYAPSPTPRPMHVTNILLEAKRWLQNHMPWWDRRGGRDHIWLMPHDEGACYMPTEIYNTSIVLTHWGRLDLDHQSGTGYNPDNYNIPIFWPGFKDNDWRDLYKGHACFTPGKDLVIPLFKPPGRFRWSPLLGAAPLERDILLYFRGDVGLHRALQYSRGIRQTFYRMAHQQSWRLKYKIFIGSGPEYPGDYSQHLARSKFCLAVPGDGYSARYVDAILHGCIPVVVMDNVTEVFETLLDWRQYAIRIKQSDIEKTPQILISITEKQLKVMQGNLAKIWHRFAWVHSPLHLSQMPEHFADNAAQNERMHAQELPQDNPFRPRAVYPFREDAFSTLIQWLHSKIK